jgi:aminoglycoside phosphotransferase (APT) family kinase protein
VVVAGRQLRYEQRRLLFLLTAHLRGTRRGAHGLGGARYPHGGGGGFNPDAPRAPRAEEALDLGRLGPYLREVLELPGASLEVLQFPGGHSNLTYLVKIGARELVLRRPPFGSKVKSAHDMSREMRALEKLAPVYPRAPRPVHFCDDEDVIGARFYLMERIRGVVLRRGATLEPDTARKLSEGLTDALVELHALDWKAIGLSDLGHPEGYVARQVSGWSKRYLDAQTADVPEMTAVAAWLAANQPPSPPATVIHNDYKYDNLVLDPDDPTRIVGVLDWEMATIGDPLMDLGTTLCYWVERDDPPEVQAFAFGPTAAPGSLTRAEVAARYAERSGRDLTHLAFYHCFGLFKTAVVAQQIYYRFEKGLTHDARFAAFQLAVTSLARQAARLIFP